MEGNGGDGAPGRCEPPSARSTGRIRPLASWPRAAARAARLVSVCRRYACGLPPRAEPSRAAAAGGSRGRGRPAPRPPAATRQPAHSPWPPPPWPRGGARGDRAGQGRGREESRQISGTSSARKWTVERESRHARGLLEVRLRRGRRPREVASPPRHGHGTAGGGARGGAAATCSVPAKGRRRGPPVDGRRVRSSGGAGTGR